MAYQIKLYDYSLEGIDFCIGSGTLSLIELNWQLEYAAGQDVDIHISSIGGSAFEAIGMYDAIKKYPGKKTTFVDSLAASAASIVAMAGDKCVMSKYAMLMIHKPMVGSGGNADQLQSDINMLDIVQSRLAGIYMDKTGLAEDVINDLINATTWMTADQAKDLGFIDEIEDYSGQEVTNLAYISKFATSTAPAVYKRVLNKLQIAQNEMKDTDKELILKTTSVLDKVMNFFKSVTNKTVTNKGALNHLGPLNVGTKVTNEAGEDVADDDYDVENAFGKKAKATVKNSVVTAMVDDEDVTNTADTEEEKEVSNVLNSVGLKVTNKAEAVGFAKVITNQLSTINTQNGIILELQNQLKVSNAAVDRDEATIAAKIKSDHTPEGSKRTNTTVTNSANDLFKPTGSVAQNAVKRAINKAPGIVQ